MRFQVILSLSSHNTCVCEFPLIFLTLTKQKKKKREVSFTNQKRIKRYIGKHDLEFIIYLTKKENLRKEKEKEKERK